MDTPPVPLSEGHRNRIAATLTVLDRLASEFERWAEGQAVHSVLYEETNPLDEDQRRELQRCLRDLRSHVLRLKQDFRLVCSRRDVASTIRARCATMWEALVELGPDRLNRYGPLPPQFAEPLQRDLPGLIQCVEAIASVVSRQNDR